MRLQPGDNPKIDIINGLVVNALGDDKELSNESLTKLLDMFYPMILKVCKKWSVYFNDNAHIIKPFDELVSDAQYWFMHYTLFKYDINGAATYNKFIHDHVNQRIRYIYECELKYFNRNIFPDPYRDNSGESDGMDALDIVIHNYSSEVVNDVCDDYLEDCANSSRDDLAHLVVSMLDDVVFNEREKEIFIKIVCHGKTHEELGESLGISRTRVTQILAKTKKKLYKLIGENDEIWKLLDDAGIEVMNDKI